MTSGTVTNLVDYREKQQEMKFTDERATSITDSLARSPKYEFPRKVQLGSSLI